MPFRKDSNPEFLKDLFRLRVTMRVKKGKL